MTTFISYSRTNSDFAVRLAKDLKAAGLDVWLDQLDIPTGARWDDEIEKALENCSTFLIILSPESIQSQNVKDEVGYAIDAGKRILPVTVENCNIPLRLRRFQYVDFSNKLYEDSLIDIKRLLTVPSNLINESSTGHTATHFAEVDDNKRKSEKPRGLLGNKTLFMLTTACFLVIAIVVGFFLFIKSAPTFITPTDTAAPSETMSSPTAATIAVASPTDNISTTILSMRLPSSQETLPNIWTENSIVIQDMPKPGVQVYSGKVLKNQEYLFPIWWCAKSLNILDENMQSISIQFFINNEPIPSEYVSNYIDDSDENWKCIYYSVVLGAWSENVQYTLEAKRILSQGVFDGQSHYAAGTYTRKLIIDVH